MQTTNRNYMFDNIKALMLFLVALGHTLDVYIDTGNFELYLMKYIYLFHMPMFAFITGYFSKDLEKSRNNAVKKCLIPYIFFQSIYILTANILIHFGIANFNSSVFSSSIILPSSAFYYLLAVFFWKLLSVDIFKLRYPLMISIALGLIISITKFRDFHEGLGAVFSLMCFFVMGVLCDEKIISKIRSIPKIISVIILLLGIIPAVYLPYSIHSVRMTYESVGFSNLTGILYRLLFYTIATLMGAAIINLMSTKQLFISRIGKASILVYAGSTFLSPHAYILVANILNLNHNRILNMAGMIVFCIFIVIICSAPVFLKWYNNLIDFINKIIFRRTKI